MANIVFKEKKHEDKFIIQVSGEIDAKTAPELKVKLELSIENGATKIILDFNELTYISSAGIGVLNSIQKYLKEKSGEIVLTSLSKEVKDTMDLMYFTKKVKVFTNLDGALVGF
ncbi:STAS domain-containing protein [Leptospira vanthielii]|uniref:Anti-sigma factor antagonist n=2 Tax=Leptospira vanthielii TaxID=293085 RepID=A0ABY2NTW5_9LEPT|nr:STAS domain-containing protein [Leptospira vanthielii]EMY71549.1 STAS domain protein [Leptospira vanthielii serovar Holland str. Waz Holland = ATCC 700522]TGM61505.1 anti-sigma factor antagonist [Leptospira vanthielii]